MAKTDIQVKPRFSGEHYRLIAERIHTIWDYEQREKLVRLFGKMFANDNEHFDWNKFRTACGN